MIDRHDALLNRLFSVDSRSLALLRMGVAAVILLDLATTRWPDVRSFYADDGMLPISVSAGARSAPGHWSLHELHGSAEFQAAMMGAAACAAVFMFLGCFTRLATIVSWVLAISLANRNLLVCNYGDTVLQLMLFWNIWIPWGDTWSVDAWRRAAAPRDLPAHRQIRSVATACAMLQLMVLYFFSGLWKWNQDWLSGSAIEHALALEYATRPAAQLLLDSALPLKMLTQATLGLELLGPLIVWSPWATDRIRLAMVASFIALHIGIELFFTPLFLSHICIVAWSLFLPESFWQLPGVRRLTSFWDEQIRRRAAATYAGKPVAADCRPSSAAISWTRRAGSAALLLVMAYIVVWNVVTYKFEKLGFLLPEQARWLGHVTLIRQTWDMFWVPSRYNAWVEARARLADGRTVDLLGRGRPAPSDPPTPNWSFLPNPRWKVYFRRLTEDPVPDVCLSSAEYLRRAWDSTQPCEQQVVHLDLVLIQRVDGGKPGTQGLVERRIARIESPETNELEDVLRRLGDVGEELRLQP